MTKSSTEIEEFVNAGMKVKPKCSKTECEAVQKGALASALDSALNVVCETQKMVRDPAMPWTSGERQALAVTLEQMGRLCYSVARECERSAVPVKGAR